MLDAPCSQRIDYSHWVLLNLVENPSAAGWSGDYTVMEEEVRFGARAVFFLIIFFFAKTGFKP